LENVKLSTSWEDKYMKILLLLATAALLSGCSVFFSDLRENQSMIMRAYEMRPSPALPNSEDEMIALEANMAQTPIERNNIKAYKEGKLDSYQVVAVEHPPSEVGGHSTVMKYLISSVYIYGVSGPFFVWRPNADSSTVAMEILVNVIKGMDYSTPILWHGRTFIVTNVGLCQYQIEEKNLGTTYFTHRYNTCK
jgi:hypothetical protein